MTSSDLHPGEELRATPEGPALTWFRLGKPDLPMVVFIPGLGHLARIAYGLPGTRPEDSLAHWLHQSGFSVLAVSYPLANPVYPNVKPEFTLRDWGTQAARLAGEMVERHRLPRGVIVLGWSMAGGIALSFNLAAPEFGIEVELFVGLAASPYLDGHNPGLIDMIEPAANGMARIPTLFYEWFGAALDEQDAINGHEILPREQYRAEMLGDFPVALMGSPIRERDGEFVRDETAFLADARPFNFEGYPLIASLSGDSPLDARHTALDASVWASYTERSFFRRHLGRLARTLPEPELWRQALALVHQAPRKLSAVVRGGHFFFVGETGARETAARIVQFREQAAEIDGQLASLLATADA